MNIDHPYTELSGGQWLRGNLHAHTTRSDGRRPPQQVIDDYATRGYDFLMISDHDIYTSPADHAALDAQGLVLIPGNEISAGGPHMLHVNANRLIEPPSDDRQTVIDAVNGSQGFIIANHPNWLKDFNACPLDRLTEWKGYTGIEIYNGVIGWHDGSPYATNKWDQLLAQGRRVWGFANDDSHGAEQELGRGWNMVYSRDRSVAAIVAAMQQGRFYASSGVTISGITVTGNRIRIESSDADQIVALHDVGRRLAVTDDRALEVEVPPDVTYVRFECWGRGEQKAWTQPFFINPA